MIEHDIVQMEYRPEQAPTLYELTIKRSFGEKLVGGYMEASKSSLVNIIETTRQTLLDTLLSLEKVFPDLTEDEIISQPSSERVNNIVTTNIYGGNNPLRIATGVNVEQKDISIIISADHFKHLEKLGVEKRHVEGLKDIIKDNKGEFRIGHSR